LCGVPMPKSVMPSGAKHGKIFLRRKSARIWQCCL